MDIDTTLEALSTELTLNPIDEVLDVAPLLASLELEMVEVDESRLEAV